MYKYYYLIGDKSKAIEPLKKLIEIEDSLDIQNIKYRLNKMKAQESISRKDYQIQLLEKDKELLGRERLILFILVSIVIVLSILLYARFRYKAKTNKQLESKNKDLQLLNTALEESKIELTDTNNAKDKMFSIIAHDLRNPVGSLKLMSGMLVEEYHSFSEEERIDFLNSLKDSTDKVYNLMENLLTWSRSQRGKIECHPMQTNMFRLVENVKDSLKNNADSKNITVYNLVKTELEMIIDPNLTATIIRNLLSNSIKFSEDNTDITIESKTSHNECTEIILRDQGIGMSDSQMQQLFALDSNNTTRGTKGEEGTGLGLLLCKEFAELQGGNIRVESKQGVGSTFYLCLNNIETPLP
jgi:signal transduction histidine kinase